VIYTLDPLFEEDQTEFFFNGLTYDKATPELKEQGGGVPIIPGYYEYLYRADNIVTPEADNHASLV